MEGLETWVITMRNWVALFLMPTTEEKVNAMNAMLESRKSENPPEV